MKQHLSVPNQSSSEPALNHSAFEARHAQNILGRLVCFDRLLLFGTMQVLHNPNALHGMLQDAGWGAFDFKLFCQPLTDALRANAEALAQRHGLTIQFITDSRLRKEDLARAILQQRGSQPGLVCIFSAMENCATFAPRKAGGQHRSDWIKPVAGRCLHYYFYFLDEQLGLLHVRVPTWLPFRLQFCLNGHDWLACRLRQAGVSFTQQDNAFSDIGDWGKAQQLSEQLDVRALEQRLQHYARLCAPAVQRFGRYYLSIAQAELSLDIAFRSPEALEPVVQRLCRESLLTVGVEAVAAYFGKSLSREAQATSKFRSVREASWCVRHHLGAQSLKLYNKGSVLRIENTSNDVSFYRHYREVVRQDGSRLCKNAPLKKQLFSLHDLHGLMRAACQRYLKHLGELDDAEIGRHNLDEITRSKRDPKQRSWRGINFFLAEDLRLVLAILRGEGHLAGWTHRRLRAVLGGGMSSGAVSRMLRRLREHGLIWRVAHTFTYYLTALGKRVLVAALKIKEHILLPVLATDQIAGSTA
jgi:DNA-binding HxlR family transcriptional regulator